MVTHAPQEGDKIGGFCQRTHAVLPETNCRAVQALFQESDDLISIAVVDGVRPVGLVTRFDLSMKLAQNYGFALYADKPIENVMNRTPLMVEADTGIDELEKLIASSHPSAMLTGFIVTTGGRFFGVGDALSLLAFNVERTKHRNRILAAARAEAEQALATKTRFLANMSHELRTPLNAIIGFSEVVSTEVFGPIGNERYAAYMADILKSANHLLSLVDDVLDMSKIENGRMSHKMEALNPVEIAAEVLRMFDKESEKAQISLRCNCVAKSSQVWVDPKALRQVAINLVGNAIKFTPSGGQVTLSVADESDEDVSFSVADTGIGMREEDISRALMPFSQVHNDDWAVNGKGGVGLGLSIVKALVDSNGGRLRIDSAPGRGTCVSVILPRPGSAAVA